jgi:hypothetical protein
VDRRASNFWVRLQAAAQLVQPSGDIGYGDDSSLADLEDLGIDDDEITPMVVGTAQLPLLIDVRAGYFSTDMSGTAELDPGWSFGDITLTDPTDVTTDISIEDPYVEVAFRLPIPTELVNAAIGLGVHGLQFTMEQQTADGQSSGLDGSVPLPTIGAHLGVNPIPLIGLEVSVMGMNAETGDGEADFIDARGQVVIRPWNYFGAVVGYRHAVYDVRLDNGSAGEATAELDLSGFYAGALVQW